MSDAYYFCHQTRGTIMLQVHKEARIGYTCLWKCHPEVVYVALQTTLYSLYWLPERTRFHEC